MNIIQSLVKWLHVRVNGPVITDLASSIINCKIQRYTFSMSQEITIGQRKNISLTSTPNLIFRPQRMTTNVPSPMFAYIADIAVAGVHVAIGSGYEDAYHYVANSTGQSLDMPKVYPGSIIQVCGYYSGMIPTACLNDGRTVMPLGLKEGDACHFTVAFKGPVVIGNLEEVK